MNNNILLADDDASIRFVVSKSLTRAGFKVRATDNAQTLMKWVKSGDGDVVLTDVHMDSDDIFNFIPELKSLRPDLPVIIMSANTSVATALKSGSSDIFEYIPKPFDLDDLQQTIKRALGVNKKTFLAKSTQMEPMIGKSSAMQPVFRAISDYMSGNIPVFIFGDVGTGKNHAAKLLHEAGLRAQRPLIMFDECMDVATLMETVMNGDLFVDRVHELTPERQSLLLRALEKNELEAENKSFRVISTSNLNPQHLQDEDIVRADLFYHLQGGEISLPSLSRRAGDIAELAEYFLNLASPSVRKSISPAAHTALESYHWPGNVRELKSLMQTISLKFSDSVVSGDILKNVLARHGSTGRLSEDAKQSFDNIRAACRELLYTHKADTGKDMPYIQALAWVEKPLIEEALRITGGNNLKAAEMLGIHRNTLRTKIKSLHIDTGA